MSVYSYVPAPRFGTVNATASLATAVDAVATVWPPCLTVSATLPAGLRPYSLAIARLIVDAVPAVTAGAVTVRVETTPPGSPPKNTSSARLAAAPPAMLFGFAKPNAEAMLPLRVSTVPQAPAIVVRFASVLFASHAVRASARVVGALAPAPRAPRWRAG